MTSKVPIWRDSGEERPSLLIQLVLNNTSKTSGLVHQWNMSSSNLTSYWNCSEKNKPYWLVSTSALCSIVETPGKLILNVNYQVYVQKMVSSLSELPMFITTGTDKSQNPRFLPNVSVGPLNNHTTILEELQLHIWLRQGEKIHCYRHLTLDLTLYSITNGGRTYNPQIRWPPKHPQNTGHSGTYRICVVPPQLHDLTYIVYEWSRCMEDAIFKSPLPAWTHTHCAFKVMS